MRNLNKFLTTLIAVLTLAAALCFSASAASRFTDVSEKDELLTKAVSLIADLDVTKGTTETTFSPNQNVTRQQMAAFIYRLIKPGKTLDNGVNDTKFIDLRDKTFFGYVSWASSTGVIKGKSETHFDPRGSITLQDAYTMIIRAIGHEKKGETLDYPYDYIELAESDGLKLNDGLPETVSYTSALTRGNVAIILYNTFFAETGYATTEQVKVPVGDQVYVHTNTVYPTVAEYYYEVKQGDFSVVATPHYAFNQSESSTTYQPLVDSFDVDTLQFVADDADSAIAEFYMPFDELSLSGDADDYIMGGFEIFYSLDEDGKTVDKVYAADGSITKKSSRSAVLNKVTPKSKSDYYNNDLNYPKLDGSITIDESIKLYFYDAPYSYLSPSYGSATTEEETYALRNAKNVKLIGYKAIDYDKGTYGYYVRDDVVTDNVNDLPLALNQIYTRGIYELDIYDVDGDGVYEYMRYKPSSFGKAVENEGHEFKDVAEHANNLPVDEANDDDNTFALSEVPTIYTYGADITGAEFKDKDFIFAYLNADANEMLVFDTAVKTKGTFSYIRKETASIKVNGVLFRTCYAYLNVHTTKLGGQTDNERTQISHSSGNTAAFGKLLSNDAIDKDFIIYSYNTNSFNNVYFYEPLSTSDTNYTASNIIIPYGDENGRRGETITQIVNGENRHFLKVWVDGAVKTVPVNVEDIYPAPEATENGYDFGITSGAENVYLDKLCTYTVDKDGIYEIKSLFHAEDEDGKYIGVNNDASTLVKSENDSQYGRDIGLNGDTARIVKLTGSRYKLIDAGVTEVDYSLLGDDGYYMDYFVMTSNTKIIIKNYISDEDEYEYLQYDMDSFAGTTSVETPLTNVQYVLKGDPDSKVRAEMLVLYAQATDFEFETKTASGDWRIVKTTYSSTDDDDKYRNYYDIYNPFTGEVVENVAGSKAYSKASNLEVVFAQGDIVKVNSNGEVDESKSALHTIDLENNDRLVFITEYTENDSLLELKPVDSEDDSVDEWLTDNGNGAYLYKVDDDTVVTVLTFSSKTKLDSAEISLAKVSDLAKPGKNILCYNEKMTKENSDKYYTEYSEYPKAYVHSSTTSKEDGLPVADFIVVMVHGDENKDFYEDDFFENLVG